MGMATVIAQNSVTLTFTCQTTDGSYLQPDSITIENLTRNWMETIYYPDTVYTLNVGTSVPDHPNSYGMQVMPNPFDGTTRVQIQTPKTENVKIMLSDLGGRICAEYNGLLQEGVNQFSVSLSTPQTYVLSVQSCSGIRSLKMENVGRAGVNKISYEGGNDGNGTVVQLKSTSDHPFQLGDEMRYQGLAIYLGNTVLSQQVTQGQNADETLVLVFSDLNPSDVDGQPCIGIPTVTDIDGNIYNTVKYGNQCWMKENLRTTRYADGTLIPSGIENNSNTDPYFYDYISSGIPLTERGYLYNWPAAMHGMNSSNAIPSGVQGVCPNGWHLPSMEEYARLIDYLENKSEYVCQEGVAKAMASTFWWNSCSGSCLPGDQSVYANNVSNFSAIPVGMTFEFINYDFSDLGFSAYFWSTTSSTENSDHVDAISILYSQILVDNGGPYGKEYGMSVRCLRD